jgi:hypothetical protein
MSDFEFPTPQPDDSDDVVLALKSARSLWDAADYSQAARWLRNAAAAAEQAGDAQRSAELAKDASSVEGVGQPVSSEPLAVQAIRVAVKRSVRDGELFVARLLEAEAVPHGSLEAFLVLTNPNADLFEPPAN